MNGKRILLLVGVLILGVALFAAGTVFAQSRWAGDEAPYGRGHMYDWDGRADEAYEGRYGPMMGPAMMGGWGGWDEGDGFADYYGMMGGTYGPLMGPGMMGGTYGPLMGPGMMGGAYGEMGPAMMGGWGGLADVEPLTIAEAEHALDEFLAELDEDNLAVGEIMIFENHAYAQVVEAGRGAGAFEVLVDPLTGNVYPEPGPNMMWNVEYGMMGGRYGGMMGGYRFPDPGDSEAVTIDAGEAVTLAQAYLDEFLPGATADEHADPFPGYYTLHVLRDGETVGMLSVNAYSGDVFPHTWHDDFIEMAESHIE